MHIKLKKFIKILPFFICLGGFITIGILFFIHRNLPIQYKSIAYKENDELLENPYCGFYELHGFLLSENSSSYAGNWAKQISEEMSGQLILLQINLKNYSNVPLSDYALNQLDTLLASFSQSGKQIILRFLYDWDGKGLETEPDSLETIKQHMTQTSNIVNKYTDHVFLLQGIYTGNYGEMNQTRYGSEEDITELMNHLASVTDPSIYLSVRTPAHLRTILKTRSPYSGETEYAGTLYSRLGLYNDGMLGSVSDLGTYDNTPFANENDYTEKGTREEELEFQNHLCQYVPNGGEVVIDNEYNDLYHAISDLSTMHVSYLNKEHDLAVINKWKDTIYREQNIFYGHTGYEYIQAHLGYRYVLTNSSIQFHPALDDTATLHLAIENTGFSPAYRRFETSLHLTNTDTEEEILVDTDIDNRKIGGGDQCVFTVPLNIRDLASGTYSLSLSMKDPYTKLSIQFANQGQDNTIVMVGTLTIP